MCDTGHHRVQVVSLDGKFLRFVGTPNTERDPRGYSFYGSGFGQFHSPVCAVVVGGCGGGGRQLCVVDSDLRRLQFFV